MGNLRTSVPCWGTINELACLFQISLEDMELFREK